MSAKRLTIGELSQATGFSRYAIERMYKGGVLPFISIGRRIYFDPELVDEALKAEAKANQENARSSVESMQPKEVIHYGRLKDLIGR